MFSQETPQIDDIPVSWEYFLHKARGGSLYAADILQVAGYAVFTNLTGQRHFEETDGEEYLSIRRDLLLPALPLPTVQAFLDQLTQDQYLAQPVTARTTPFHAYDFYTALWRKRRYVSDVELVHDAALYCSEHWWADEYERLTERVSTPHIDDNSQDIVAAILMLLATWTVKR